MSDSHRIMELKIQILKKQLKAKAARIEALESRIAAHRCTLGPTSGGH
jgi:hypothetical protein